MAQAVVTEEDVAAAGAAGAPSGPLGAGALGRRGPVSDVARHLLDRAIAAEDRAEELERELADVRSRLRAVIGSDPTTAVSALGWIWRCERAESLLGEIVRYLDQRSLTSTQLPDGWEARARAQIKAAEIAQRDQRGFDRPGLGDEYWTTYETEDGTQRTIIERRPPS